MSSSVSHKSKAGRTKVNTVNMTPQRAFLMQNASEHDAFMNKYALKPKTKTNANDTPHATNSKTNSKGDKPKKIAQSDNTQKIAKGGNTQKIAQSDNTQKIAQSEASSPVSSHCQESNNSNNSASPEPKPQRRGRKLGSKNKPKIPGLSSEEIQQQKNAERKLQRHNALVPWSGEVSNIMILPDASRGVQSDAKDKQCMIADAAPELQRLGKMRNSQLISIEHQGQLNNAHGRAKLEQYIKSIVSKHRLPVTQHRQVLENYQMRIDDAPKDVILMDKDVYDRAKHLPLVWREITHKGLNRIGVHRRLWVRQSNGVWLAFDQFMQQMEFSEEDQHRHVGWHKQGNDLDFRRDNMVFVNDTMETKNEYPFFVHIKVHGSRGDNVLVANYKITQETKRKYIQKMCTLNDTHANNIKHAKFAELVACLALDQPWKRNTGSKQVKRKRVLEDQSSSSSSSESESDSQHHEHKVQDTSDSNKDEDQHEQARKSRNRKRVRIGDA